MSRLASRTGREYQRYSSGRRQVVGCIPYRYVKVEEHPSCSSPPGSINMIEEVQVLLITSQKSSTMMFPKGGWEYDETMEKAAERECMEEAGVIGSVQGILGTWRFQSKSQNAWRDGFMFPLLVQEQLDHWPEENSRQRQWFKLKEARERCGCSWMKEALEALVERLGLVVPWQQQPGGGAIDISNEGEAAAWYWSIVSAERVSKCSARKLERPPRNGEVPQNC